MAINFPLPWKPVDDHRRKYISGELAWELSHFPDHPLATQSFELVAMMDAYDNAVIRFEDGTFAYVHLSWKMEPPYFELIGGENELVGFLHGRATFRENDGTNAI